MLQSSLEITYYALNIELLYNIWFVFAVFERACICNVSYFNLAHVTLKHFITVHRKAVIVWFSFKVIK